MSQPEPKNSHIDYASYELDNIVRYINNKLELEAKDKCKQ